MVLWVSKALKSRTESSFEEVIWRGSPGKVGTQMVSSISMLSSLLSIHPLLSFSASDADFL